MQSVLRLVLAIAEGRAAEAMHRALGRAAFIAAAGVVVVCCAIGAVGCALAALWIFAAQRVGEVWAPLIVSALLAVIGILLAASMRSRKRRVPPAMDIDHAVVIAELAELVRENKVSTVLAAFLAGLTAGTRRS
jgi:cytochrome c biogenesis protein CcdA